MRLPNSAHESRPWRIRTIAPDFTLEDVWALPVEGGAADFPALLEVMGSLGPAGEDSPATRILWRTREILGSWFGWDEAPGQPSISDRSETSLADRLPADLRHTAAAGDSGSLPFVPLYRTDVEFAAELSNRTVHAVMHLGWIDQGEGRYAGQMAVYVKPRGLPGQAYMNLIRPFRYWIVYPALLRRIEKAWNARAAAQAQAGLP